MEKTFYILHCKVNKDGSVEDYNEGPFTKEDATKIFFREEESVWRIRRP